MRTLGLRDIIGPVMVGPSSSHTAGALAIARMTRRLCGATPPKVRFTLYGSFAHTGVGHGTDKALVAGILGMNADDLGIRDSFQTAKDQGVDFSFEFDTNAEVDHPNTVDVTVIDQDGHEFTVRGESLGGGSARIVRIGDVDVNITGERTSLVVLQKDERGVLAHISLVLAEHGVNIATARLYRTRRHDIAYTVLETDDEIPPALREAILAHSSIHEARVIPPAQLDDAADSLCELPGAEELFRRWDYANAKELIERCADESVSIAEAFAKREQGLWGLRGVIADIDAYLDRVLVVMREAACVPLTEPRPSTGGLIGGEAKLVTDWAREHVGVLDPLSQRVVCYALAALETNAAMGRIVANPTAGSSGVLPAVLLGLQDERGFSDEQLHEALLTAAAVGYLFARNASVSGAEGGCQAEIGSAAAMAAAAAVSLAGGDAAQCFNAATNVIMSLMGLVCDPVGGLVEVPCQKRNATAALTALASAQMALAGVGNLVSFDEAVEVMDRVGRALPFELRESALGGIAQAPSACAFCDAHETC